MAHLHNEMGSYQYAIQCGRAALGLARSFSAETCWAYNVLCASYYLLGNIQDALLCYESAIEVVTWHLGETHPLLLEIHRNLADLYMGDERFQDAVACYESALSVSIKSF